MADVDVPDKNEDDKNAIENQNKIQEPSANTNDPKLKELYKQIRDIHSKQIKVHKHFEAAFYRRQNKKSIVDSEEDKNIAKVKLDTIIKALNDYKDGVENEKIPEAQNKLNQMVDDVSQEIIVNHANNMLVSQSQIKKRVLQEINNVINKNTSINTKLDLLEKLRHEAEKTFEKNSNKDIRLHISVNNITEKQVKNTETLLSLSIQTAVKMKEAYIEIQKAVAAFPDGIKPKAIEAQREADDAVKKADKSKSLSEEALKLAKASISEKLTPKQKQIAIKKANAAAIAAETAANETEIAATSMLQKISIAEGEISEEDNTLNDAIKSASQMAKDAASKAKQAAEVAVQKAKQTSTKAKEVIQNVTSAVKTGEDALQETEKSIEDDVSERTNMLVLLNDLINETSVMSMQTDKRYLYVMEYKQDKNTNAKIFDNEDIKEEEPTINDKIKDVAANSIEKVKETGKKMSQITQDVGSSLGRIIKNKLTNSENNSRINTEASVKLSRAQKEAEIAAAKAKTAQANASYAEAKTAEKRAKIDASKLEKETENTDEDHTPSAPQPILGGGNDDLNQKLSFIVNKDDIDSLRYKDLVIVEYSTNNVSEIDNDVIEGDQDYYQYIANFQEFIKNNNDGKGMNFADRTKDRSLLVKRYPIHQYFSYFNKNIGFDYKSVKDNYMQNAGKYKDNVEKYSKRLDKFFHELENFKNNDSLNTITNKFGKSLNNIQFLFQKYYGFILIIILIIILFASYLNTVIQFFNSVYSRKMSLSPSLIDNSMYDSYARVFSMTIMGNEQYFDYKTMLHFIIYVILFIMIVSINIYYLNDSYNGRLRVMNFIPHPWSTHEVYIFDKRANTLMFYGIILLIFIIIINMIYYFTVFTQSDIFKTRYEGHNEIQKLYNNIDLELLDLFLRYDVYEENKEQEPTFLDSYDAKLASWMFNGTEEEINSRIGLFKVNGADAENKDSKRKRFKIFATIIFANHFVTTKYKKSLFDLSNLKGLSNTEKPSIFLYSKEETLDGVLPPDYSSILSKDSETMRIILVDLKSDIVSKYNKIKSNNNCHPDDKRYLCKNDLTNHIIPENSMQSLKTYFDEEYKTIYKQVQKQRIKIKSKDSAIMYRVDVILSFIFMLILGLCLIQIFLWLFFDNLDIYEAFISKHISKIKTIFQIIVLIIILIVIL